MINIIRGRRHVSPVQSNYLLIRDMHWVMAKSSEITAFGSLADIARMVQSMLFDVNNSFMSFIHLRPLFILPIAGKLTIFKLFLGGQKTTTCFSYIKLKPSFNLLFEVLSRRNASGILTIGNLFHLIKWMCTLCLFRFSFSNFLSGRLKS